MRILTWNINGVRTVPQYHPWNAFKTWDGVLKELKADIICFQEMKTTRAAIGRNFALPDSFDAFFSFPTSRGGYSGVAVYTNPTTAFPIKAEEGLSGRIQPKPPLLPEERVSTAYPLAYEMDLMPSLEGETPSDLTGLDSEGRALVVDFGLFVLINLYCPNETSDARLPFKMNYHYMLEERVKKLVAEGREVIVTGDINICSQPIDHCDGHLPSNAATFWDHPARKWLRDWLEPHGPMIDVTRRFWPDREGMYTCWNQKIMARATNYGTRIDYFLVTKGLMPWIKDSDIQPSVKGSDHCPVFIDLHDEITLESGEKRSLRKAMRMDEGRTEPPRTASKFWPELLGKQTLMSSFFTKPKASAQSPTTIASVSVKSELPSSPAAAQSALSSAFEALESIEDPTPTPPPTQPLEPVDELAVATAYSLPSRTPDHATSQRVSESPTNSTSARPSTPSASQGLRPGTRKRAREEPKASSSKSKKAKNGQIKLSSFFSKPASSPPPDAEILDVDSPSSSQQDADYKLACELAASQDVEPVPSSQGSASSKGKEAWSNLFAPVQPPKCNVHGEIAKEFRVNKPGPNKGKAFYVCSRPVGPGYDKGRGERLREEVDHQYKCDFFKWQSDVKRASLRESKKT
ncbi:DNase I-like protein [Peniophora sp. CONT]|nr:DNase I-like protein [Peniophora sp. CONT]